MRCIDDLLRARAAERPDAVYLVTPGLELTYSEMERRVGSTAAGLAGRGLKPGQRVALLLGNTPHFLYAWWGLTRLGAVMVPVNLRLTAREAAYIVGHCGAQMVIAGPEAAEILPELKAQCPAVRHWLSPADLEVFLALPPRAEPCPAGPDDLASILYTSGTTGFPKGVMHSQANYLRTAQAFMLSARLTPDDRVMTCNPLFHVNAQFYTALGSLYAGAACLLMEKFSASQLWGWTREYRANKLVLLLALTTILYNREPAPDDADNPVQWVVAGGAPKGRYRDFERRFGVKLQTLYSLTESPLAVMGHPDEPVTEGALGRGMLTPAAEPNLVRVVDAAGAEQPAGEPGEIAIKNAALMRGYFHDPEATAQAVPDGWLRTGDRGVSDAEGRLYFLGRAKDVIRVKGENVAAAEVESVLMAHPAVAEAAVAGVETEDSAGEQVILACLIWRPGQSADWAELIAHCQAALAGFKVPRLWQARPELPKNAMNRVVKAALCERWSEAAPVFDRGR
ncbi:MAG: AMP-binding protein [Pseudomonadota bacterium]